MSLGVLTDDFFGSFRHAVRFVFDVCVLLRSTELVRALM